MFGQPKKPKKSPEELRREEDERIAATASRLQTQILKAQKQKAVLVAKMAEARRLGLTAQEATAKALLVKCMTVEKQVNGMLMNLELAVQAKEISGLTREFVDCMGIVSQSMLREASKTDIKKAEQQYLRALYATEQQSQQLDGMLQTGNFAMLGSTVGQGGTSEFDAEIDVLVRQAGDAGTMGGQAIR